MIYCSSNDVQEINVFSTTDSKRRLWINNWIGRLDRSGTGEDKLDNTGDYSIENEHITATSNAMISSSESLNCLRSRVAGGKCRISPRGKKDSSLYIKALLRAQPNSTS